MAISAVALVTCLLSVSVSAVFRERGPIKPIIAGKREERKQMADARSRMRRDPIGPEDVDISYSARESIADLAKGAVRRFMDGSNQPWADSAEAVVEEVDHARAAEKALEEQEAQEAILAAKQKALAAKQKALAAVIAAEQKAKAAAIAAMEKAEAAEKRTKAAEKAAELKAQEASKKSKTLAQAAARAVEEKARSERVRKANLAEVAERQRMAARRSALEANISATAKNVETIQASIEATKQKALQAQKESAKVLVKIEALQRKEIKDKQEAEEWAAARKIFNEQRAAERENKRRMKEKLEQEKEAEEEHLALIKPELERIQKEKEKKAKKAASKNKVITSQVTAGISSALAQHSIEKYADSGKKRDKLAMQHAIKKSEGDKLNVDMQILKQARAEALKHPLDQKWKARVIELEQYLAVKYHNPKIMKDVI